MIVLDHDLVVPLLCCESTRGRYRVRSAISDGVIVCLAPPFLTQKKGFHIEGIGIGRPHSTCSLDGGSNYGCRVTIVHNILAGLREAVPQCEVQKFTLPVKHQASPGAYLTGLNAACLSIALHASEEHCG